MSIPVSVLDLVPVMEGQDSRQALHRSLDLAIHVEELGYNRYWLAEHHNLRSTCSSAPEIILGQVAHRTQHLRVGSGGIMLSNHAPLRVAESFRTLEAFFPGRIDLGLGRAAGADSLTALVLRRCQDVRSEADFEERLAELLAYDTRDLPVEHPLQKVIATPSDIPLPPLWLLTSSGHGARTAAAIGSGLAFAAQINPNLQNAAAAIQTYRAAFQPSARFERPQTLLSLSVILADNDNEAERLAHSVDLALVRVLRGQDAPLPPPEAIENVPFTSEEHFRLEAWRHLHVIGGPTRVRDRLQFILNETGVDELMISSIVHDSAARQHSYTILRDITRRLSVSMPLSISPGVAPVVRRRS
ncbi:LLM class flavin-dependent oxidoreductase [Deinococcus sp. QL22]|uniref:LLM class flavin-dependent oxidoreductase n=1 Tax=Deinococcus sp. QL22 TaxID=2939437 RepID=UPI0020174260|nr:LLM class flavin-dependent oxidoreductase [Deinococcus sp. QL22]UQN08025.1 LLM class flavin-dependent oxidoreductase [Deinococcus sp. QL22]